MPALIHLNGPPGIGKSSTARELATRLPGTVCIDIDSLRVALPNWRADPETKRVARNTGFAQVADALRDGNNVVLPQLVVLQEVVDQLATIAADAGASFHEVVLVATEEQLAARLELASDSPHPRAEFTPMERLRKRSRRWTRLRVSPTQ